MKKHFFPIMCAFLVLLSSTAHAATRAAAVVPRISFNGTTASCTVFVAADRPTDDGAVKSYAQIGLQTLAE